MWRCRIGMGRLHVGELRWHEKLQEDIFLVKYNNNLEICKYVSLRSPNFKSAFLGS
jgi:hypothetical protein